ncbi:hypothetical protein ACFPRL_04650 [Pseudoclavibacter helvolus]
MLRCSRSRDPSHARHHRPLRWRLHEVAQAAGVPVPESDLDRI